MDNAYAGDRRASAARGFIRVRWMLMLGIPCSESRGSAAYFVDWQVLVQILVPFGVVERLSLNQRYETFGFNVAKVLRQHLEPL
jgi:hypothetical protein